MGAAHQIQQAVSGGQRSAVEVVQECLEAIGRCSLNAFVSVSAERALDRARAIDDAIRRRVAVGPLAGVPVALKDNICTAWGTTTCGSRMLRDYRSPFSAHVVDRLEAAGAIIVGKTNLDEYAMGSSTENSAVGAARNPWNPRCVPGGSSGGSTAAVAAGRVPIAVGSDTGGSIRQPASFCNVVGLKPTYGRVSRYGLVAFGSSLDQIGPIARDVRDAALLLEVLAGPDPRDSTALDAAVPPYASELERSIKGLRIGVPAEFFGDGLDPEVRRCVEDAINDYAREGAQLVDIHIPHLKYAVACYYLIGTAEASSNLARFDGVHYGHRAAADEIVDLYSASRSEGFGTEVKRRIMLGTYALSSGYYDAYYGKAMRVRTRIRQDYDAAFEAVDLIASPTSPVPPFEFGARTADPLKMYLADVYTVSANLAGICAISLPCGFTDQGLPVGLQLQAPALQETRLLQAAWVYQQGTDWHLRRPEAAHVASS